MYITIDSNGPINGWVYSARRVEIAPDVISLSVGSTDIQMPVEHGSVEVRVLAPNGVLLGTDDVELYVNANLNVQVGAHGRITVKARDVDGFSMTTWVVRLAEPEKVETRKIDRRSNKGSRRPLGSGSEPLPDFGVRAEAP